MTVSSISSAAFMSIDIDLLSNIAAQYVTGTKPNKRAIAQARRAADDVFLQIETCVNFNQDLRDSLLDIVRGGLTHAIEEYTDQKMDRQMAVQYAETYLSALDQKIGECVMIMGALSGEPGSGSSNQSVEQALALFAEAISAKDKSYLERWDKLVLSEKQKHEAYTEKRTAIGEVVDDFASMENGEIGFVQKYVSEATRLVDAVKRAYDSGYADHADSFAAVPPRAVFEHMNAFNLRKLETERQRKEAELYAELSDAWLSKSVVSERLLTADFSPANLEQLKRSHQGNKATLAVRANGRFTNTDLNANVKYVEMAYEAVATDRSIVSIPGVSSWFSRLVGSSERKKAVGEVIARSMARAEANVEAAGTLTDEMILESLKRWRAACAGPLSEYDEEASSELSLQHEVELMRFEAAMRDLPFKKESPLFSSGKTENTIVESGNLQVYLKHVGKLRDGAETLNAKMEMLTAISARVPLPSSDGVKAILSGEEPPVERDVDNVFLNVAIDDLKLLDRIATLGLEGAAGDIRDIVHFILMDIEEKAKINLIKRDELLKNEIDLYKTVISNAFSGNDPDPDDDRPRRSQDERRKIFSEGWASAMTVWEREDAWPRIAKRVLGEADANQFTSKRPAFHQRSAVAASTLKMFDLLDNFLDATPQQSKEDLFKSMLANCAHEIDRIDTAKENLKHNNSGRGAEDEGGGGLAVSEIKTIMLAGDLQKCLPVWQILEAIWSVWRTSSNDPDSVVVEGRMEYLRTMLVKLQQGTDFNFTAQDQKINWIRVVTKPQLPPRMDASLSA
ncbi:hypothetical protein [Pararhizobium arenae]|uniref:hypothetical protein n=1 Tax=Pararhizobium arenae TaxID=1856850 RepID=UPI000AE1DF03|nr:hypothetical protein [Pararhizobium arenae]